MTVAAKATRSVEAKLPIDPRELLDLESIERGRLYNSIPSDAPHGGLDAYQRACVEEAIRMLRAGTYPEADG